MRKLLLLTLGMTLLFQTPGFGQTAKPGIDAQTLHQLVEQSIDEQGKLLKYVIINPALKADSIKHIYRINQSYYSSFEEKDFTFIQHQLSHPAFTLWDKGKFKHVKVCRQYRGCLRLWGLFRCRETYFVDLPLYSSDLTTVAIVFESCSKPKFYRLSSCAGFYIIWKYIHGQWVIEKEGVTYIT